jgi:hypothetical protein
MGLPKSKAQIAWRRYWVVCLLGGGLPDGAGFLGFFAFDGGWLPAGRFLSVFSGRWPFLELLVVY